MGFRDLFRKRADAQTAPTGPAAEGEIISVKPTDAVIHTTDDRVLRFDPAGCAAFRPQPGQSVSVGRVEGGRALDLRLLATRPAPDLYEEPTLDEHAVMALVDAAGDGSAAGRLSMGALHARLAAHPVEWDAVFTRIDRRAPGLTLPLLAEALHAAQDPFERREIEEILAASPDATVIPNALAAVGDRWSASWLSFLRWANGGDFATGDREFQMLSVAKVREFTTTYGVATRLPGAVPFALDGEGGVYVFDTRAAPVDGEFPVAWCHSAELAHGWSAATALESSFLACCRATRPPDAA